MLHRTLSGRLALALVLAAAMFAGPRAKAETRWTIDSTGIVMDAAANAPHSDHIEMSGLKAAIVYYWSIDEDGRYSCEFHHIFPLPALPPAGGRCHAGAPLR